MKQEERDDCDNVGETKLLVLRQSDLSPYRPLGYTEILVEYNGPSPSPSIGHLAMNRGSTCFPMKDKCLVIYCQK